MRNEITVFVGRGVCALGEKISNYTCVREFSYKRCTGQTFVGGEGRFILYCLGRKNEGGFIDEVAVGYDNGEFDPIFFDDWIARVDEAEDLAPYFNELISIGVEIFYFAELESSVERLRKCGVPISVYRKEE